MNIDQMYPTKWISAPDLQGNEVLVTITRISMEEVEPGKIKPTLWFQGKTKGLVLNKTNANNISFLYGPETDTWIGKSITLISTWVDYKGESKLAIRIKPQANPQGAVQQQQTPQQQGNAAQAPSSVSGEGPATGEFDDEIPF